MVNFKELFLIFLRGLIMGVADIIPGVSGGTMALITGIYERLIKAISNINHLIVKEVFRSHVGTAFKNIKKIDFALLVPLLLGIAIAFISLAHLMDYLLLNWSGITYAFFFGLILASAIFVYKYAGKNFVRNIIFLVIGFVFAFWFIGLDALQTNHSSLVILFAGAIAISAMILPGISGAFILVLLGQYEHIINALKNFDVGKITLFLIGAIVGILVFSKVLDYLLNKHKFATMSFLTGLMLGSLRLPYNEVAASSRGLLWPIVAGIIGFLIVFLLEKKFNKD